ncbi:MAG: NUDIX hydrolase [Candidatus Omnitrophota bacterium]
MEKDILIKKGQFISFFKKQGWEYVRRTNCRGVVIVLAVTDENEVIFTEQYRIPLGRKVIEFPAGLIADGPHRKKESALDAARRELLEETGYRAKRIQKIIEGPTSSGLTSDTIIMVRALGLRKISPGGGDETEAIVVHAVPLASAEKWLSRMRRKGYLVDPKVYAGLYFLNKYNKQNSSCGYHESIAQI